MSKPSMIMLIAAFLSVSACSWLPSSEPETATLADLQPSEEARYPTSSVEPVSLETLLNNYRQLLPLTEDPATRQAILQRLAGLEMLHAESQLEQQADAAQVFMPAITAYQELVENHPQRNNSDQLLYQLSKAYQMAGQENKSIAALDQMVEQHPNSDHYHEAQFRRAESFFAAGNYRAAAATYGTVSEQSKSDRYRTNALYMQGWSQFKLARYQRSLKSFIATLDALIADQQSAESLSRAQREMVADTYRIMAVAFSYLDGPQSIAESLAGLQPRHYEADLYDRLGELYLDKKRYRDSADSYRAFIKQHPYAEQVPTFYVKLIGSFEAGQFAKEVLAEKQQFADYFHQDKPYWQQASEPVKAQASPYLNQYLKELAQHYHATAQAHLKIKTTDKSAAEQQAQLAQAQQYFRRAGDYYRQFISTFADDPAVPEMWFLMAESRYEAGDYQGAITAYETTAYQFDQHQHGAEAGYAAVLAYDKWLAELPAEQQALWREASIVSALRFSQHYADHPQAIAVHAKAAEHLLAQQAYSDAVLAVDDLLERLQPQQISVQRTAWLVKGHSQFAMAHYAQSEQAYQQVLQLEPAKTLRVQIIERLAASIYKQGELAQQNDQHALAAQQYLRVVDLAPESSIAINAQFDAANQWLAIKEWSKAIAVLQQFRSRHPNHALAQDMPAQLAFAYQQNQQWLLAADELLLVKQADDNAKRESDFVVAELYERGGDRQRAVIHYRSYAHAYPQPVAMAMEAQYRLSELYLAMDESYKRRFWLRKMIAADASAGNQRSDRSRYLAAFSSSVFAADSFQAFQAIKLRLPLKKSLKKKKQALKKVVAAYEKTTTYGIEEFVTESTYGLGQVYGHLAEALMASERPKKLDAMALEQYEMLLEDQAYPFEEKAITIHETNSQRSWQGIYDQWVKQSFDSLALLLPGRYQKQEQRLEFSDDIY